MESLCGHQQCFVAELGAVRVIAGDIDFLVGIKTTADFLVGHKDLVVVAECELSVHAILSAFVGDGDNGSHFVVDILQIEVAVVEAKSPNAAVIGGDDLSA